MFSKRDFLTVGSASLLSAVPLVSAVADEKLPPPEASTPDHRYKILNRLLRNYAEVDRRLSSGGFKNSHRGIFYEGESLDAIEVTRGFVETFGDRLDPEAVLMLPAHYVKGVWVESKRRALAASLSIEDIVDGKRTINQLRTDALIELAHLEQEVTDRGAVFCPYVLASLVRAVDTVTFQPKIGFVTTYGTIEPKVS